MALNKRIRLFLSTSDITDRRPLSLLINELELIASQTEHMSKYVSDVVSKYVTVTSDYS